MENQIEIYQTPDHQTRIEVRFDQDTVWLNQYQLAELFQGSRPNILEHIKNIYKTGELDDESTCRNFRQVRMEGKRKVKRQTFYGWSHIEEMEIVKNLIISILNRRKYE